MTKDVLKYLQPNAVIPIDMETTTALVNALKERLAQPEQEPTPEIKYKMIVIDDLHPQGIPVEQWVNPPQRTEQNFCSRCGKRTPDLITIHTCTPPKEGT
jgi:hypothetical protein